MPGFDATGPVGMGPRTGWGRGLCKPQEGQNANVAGPWAGFGAGRGGMPWGGGRGRAWGGGRGRGRGRGGWGRGPMWGAGAWYPDDSQWQEPAPTLPPSNEKTYLKRGIKALERELEEMKRRLEGLAAEDG